MRNREALRVGAWALGEASRLRGEVQRLQADRDGLLRTVMAFDPVAIIVDDIVTGPKVVFTKGSEADLPAGTYLYVFEGSG